MKHLKFFIFLCILSFTVSCGQQKRLIQYKVKKGETMSKIAQKLNMAITKLERLNPDVVGNPKANTFIVVPEDKLDAFQKEVKPYIIEEKDSITDKDIVDEEIDLLEKLKENFEIYQVAKGDTFFNIKKRFGVNRQELLLLNPELKEGLKLGMILKLREKKIATVLEEDVYDDYIAPNTNLKVALLLPFKAYKYQADTLSLKEIFVQDAALLNITTDFYLGAELAIDSIRNKGVAIDFSVFDTGERSDGSIPKLVYDQNLNGQDVIIGPLYSSEVQALAANVNVPIVFPVYSRNQSQFTSSNIIKTSPEKKILRETLEGYIKENFEEGNIIIVNDSIPSEELNSDLLKSNLAFGTNAVVNVIEPIGGYIAKERFLEFLKPNTNNWVVIASNNQVIASDAINSLISLPDSTSARAFAFNKGKTYDKIDNAKLAKLNFTYVTEEFEDESSYESITFNSYFKTKNKTLPSYYATKGFDITYDILMRLASGKGLRETFKEGISKRVETKFDYSNSSYLSENKGVFILKYNEDLTLSKIK